ncbi:putative leucine-rich repeat-containing protein DDB_G0290503 isoform X1 [Euwallacea similis]|uniref:putative leucine-rich repeat-containing protein DDB_G0290503 isoform X1 n=1 Tax=Euwallacea similis TaxID=1736056 RepID=UPI00344C7324
MHSLYPMARGDPLCPLGFHPQVRWPTRCKRCFRDYKEHGGKKKDESNLKRDISTASTPSLSNSAYGNNSKSWLSSTNLAGKNDPPRSNGGTEFVNPSSWTSTPDLANLEDDTHAVPTVSIKLPKRKPKPIEPEHRTASDSFSLLKEGRPSIYDKNDSLAARVKKLQAIKENTEKSIRRPYGNEVKSISEEPHVHLSVQIKRNLKKEQSVDSSSSSGDQDDVVSNAGTDTTDTTLVGTDNELREQLEALKKELETTKSKCDRLEREKSDILLRRLAAMETTTSKTSASEVLKLQQRCNDMKQQLEDIKDEKRSLTLKVKELEAELDLRPTVQEAQKTADELRSKLLAAETVCEELMDENEDMKKEIREMEEQIEEMQDNFREDQAVEYTSIKKELDQTTKNCRILSFKLRKAERKVDQLDGERDDMKKKLAEISADPKTISNQDLIKKLEQDLKISNEVSLRLQKELEESNRKLEESVKTSVKKAPGVKPPLCETKKLSRESLTRGGSQDDPSQLLRDLQDSMEREADLKEQLKFAEEDGQNLRKKVSRIEEDNESLVLQLKKMANRAKGRKLSSGDRKSSAASDDKKSLSEDENLEELKLQLELSEQEASVLRKKVEELEADNRGLESKVLLLNGKLAKSGDKPLVNGNKSKQSQNEKVKNEIMKFATRTPKKISALTSRDQLKTMVADLEKEINDILTCAKTIEVGSADVGKSVEMEKTLKELQELKVKFEGVKKDLDNEKSKRTETLQKTEKMNSEIKTLTELLENTKSDKSKVTDQLKELERNQKRIQSQKNEAETQISQLKEHLRNLESKNKELVTLNKQIDGLKVSLQEKDNEMDRLKKDSEDLRKLRNENLSKDKKISDLENRLSKLENKYSECDKSLKDNSKDLKNKIEKEKNKTKTLEDIQNRLEKDKSQLSAQLETFNLKIKSYEDSLEQKNKTIKQLEDRLSQVSELESKLELSNKNHMNLEKKLKKVVNERENSKFDLEKRVKELQIEVQNEKKKFEILKGNSEKEQKNRDLELECLKNKIRSLEIASIGGRKQELKVDYFQESIKKLEDTIVKERQKYDDLSAKYEILEEEHVVVKAKLVMQIETLENQLTNLKKDYDQLEQELKALRETYKKKSDAWTKEKLDLEQKLRDIANLRLNEDDIDKQRLKALFEEKQSELDQIKKEYDLIHDQMEYMRKENDELNRKLNDYEKVNKVQRNISADSTAMEKELKHLRIKLHNAEKTKKTEIGECKMRYENQLNLVNQEMQSLQNQVMRFKRERDNYKHMLEMAQKSMAELKHSPKLSNIEIGSKEKLYYDELEESKSKIANLDQQINCMEDELSEARLESSRLKTELISEKTSWEIRLLELHSKVNELEEEKVLNSGRTKIMGLKTRMELAWHKEREEQQRLLQETATLARDLRQTLFEAERERDKERLETKRKYDQLKKSADEEQDESKRKATELQCDLLELRDAHAKLRTTNEKLRREKERYEKERDEFKTVKYTRRRLENEEERKIEKIIEQVDILKQLAPELFFSKEEEDTRYTPTPPRRTKSKSRESSPVTGVRGSSLGPEDKQQRIQGVMQMLVQGTEDLRRMQKHNEDEEERERLRRSGMRRATSTEAEQVGSARYSRSTVKKVSSLERQGSLYRKSLSLEHNLQAEQKIWRNENKDSSPSLQTSSQSLEWDTDAKGGKPSDSTVDSRLSTSSTQSDTGERKKSAGGFMNRLWSLTKSRSIDDQDPGIFSSNKGLGSKDNSRNNSNSDVNEEKGSKKDLRERITGIFRRGGSSSRSNSVERNSQTSSTQRPLVRKGSNNNLEER